MSAERPRRLLAVLASLPVVAALLVSASPAQAVLPETVTVHDSRTSDPVVDISEVEIEASWYWDSEQTVYVRVPHGFRPGHRLTVWFDLDGDSTPDGHYDLQMKPPKKRGSKHMVLAQEFRRGGGWTLGGTKARCSDGEGFSPAVAEDLIGGRDISLAMDLWSCLGVPSPGGASSGSWRVAVRVAKGSHADMAPNGRRWSKPVAGWGPCDPSGGSCG